MAIIRCSIIILLLLAAVGCGVRQINELAIVTAVGIDAGKKPGTVKVTGQIIRPADARGQTGAPSGGTGEPIYSVSAEGRTIFEAIRNMARFSSRRVYWAHNFIIVVNEKYAKAGIRDMIDFFTRNHELRMNTWVAVTGGSASEVIATVTGLEVVPGQAIDKLFFYNEYASESPSTNMMRLQESFLSKTTHPVLARLELRPRGISNKKPEQFGSIKQVELSGTAVFKREKMVGWLTPEESRVLLFFIEKPGPIVMPTVCPNDEKQYATLEAREIRFRVKPFYEDERAKFNVKLDIQADLVETGCNKDARDIRDELEAQLEKQFAQQFESLYRKAQKEYKVDIMKLGETFHNQYPKQWKQLEGRWEDQFQNVEIKTVVNVKLNNPVLKFNGE